MNSINEKVKGEFLEWAKNNEDKEAFPRISKEKDSYYINRNSEETYMMEYSFKTIAELREALEKYSGLADEQQMLKRMAVEVCRNRFKSASEMDNDKINLQIIPKAPNAIDEGKEKKEFDGEKVLPEFIYIF